jgi:DDE superfamily endonuclease
MCGKVNFMNMSRYSDLSERTYRRQYAASFPYMALNRQLIELAIPATVAQIGVMDCSVIRKSGKGTVGLDWFYNGSASRSEKGLEISVGWRDRRSIYWVYSFQGIDPPLISKARRSSQSPP